MFNFTRVRTILDKEWVEVFKNRTVLFTVILLPVIFTVMPLAMLFGTRSSGGESADVPATFLLSCIGFSGNDCMQVFMINEFMLLFMMMPLIIPITIAAYSIVGEKTTRSLEPLLATPITTEELLAGKGLAAVIPGVAATFVCFIIFLLVSPLTGISPAVQAYLGGPIWLLGVFGLGPMMALFAVMTALLISSRVNDPRAAEQLSSVVIIPLMAIIFAQLAGIIILSAGVMLVTIAAFAAVDVGMVYLGARLFQREAILTRWK